MKKIGAGVAGDLVWGIHAVRAVLDLRPESVLQFWATPTGVSEELAQQAERSDIHVERLSKQALDKLSGSTGGHQGVLMRYRPLEELDEKWLLARLKRTEDFHCTLVLDGVTDAQNLGACMRSADVFGADAVALPRHRSASITPAGRKVACGAAERIPLVRLGNLARSLRSLQERQVHVVGLAQEAEHTLYDMPHYGTATALVLGAEDSGLGRLTRDCCDTLVRIPVLGGTSSLNVSAAAAIALYEVRRRVVAAGQQANSDK